MADGRFRQMLSENAAARYEVHSMSLQVDLPSFYEALLPDARAFVEEVIGPDGNPFMLGSLYSGPWRDRPSVIERFFRLGPDAQLEALSYFMVPIHEYRHHLDMVTTPFGAYFHVLATDEFRRFQNIAMDIVRKLDEPDSAGPGRLVSLDKWLHDNSIELGDTSRKHWNVLLRQMRLLEAWGDFNQVKPATVEEAPDDKLPLMGSWVRPVLVNGFLKSYTNTKDSPANMSSGRWYVTPATILEGRAVLASLLWGTRQLRGHPSAGSVLSRWFRETYPATGNQDYRFIADLVASFNKHPDIESYLGAKAGAENFETRLRIFGLATWVALHTPPPRPGEDAAHCDPAVRLYAALRHAQEILTSDQSQFSEEDFTERFDSSNRAGHYKTHSVEKSLEQSISITEKAMTVTHEIINEEVASHFQFVGGAILANLRRRVGKGYYLRSAVPSDGNPLTRIGADEGSLLEPYEAPYWVREWFRFRRTTFFRPTSAAVTSKYLFEQFNMFLALRQCDCGALLGAEMPMFMRAITITCPNCGKKHHQDRQDATVIHIPTED